MKRQHFVGKIATKTIIAKGDKILMARNHKNPDTWDLPGGRIDIGEDIEAAVKREIMEELGVDAVPGPFLYSEQLVHTGDDTAHFFITLLATLKNPSDNFKIPSEELAEVKWVSKHELDEMKVYANCVNAIKAYWEQHQ